MITSVTPNPILQRAAKHLAASAMLSLLFALASPSAIAQTPTTGSVSGRVYDTVTDQFIRNAEIHVAGTDAMVRSEEWGFYQIDNLPAGTVNISLMYTGREARAYKVVISAGTVTRMELELGAPIAAQVSKKDDDIVLLEKFTVTAELEGNAKALMEQKSAMNMKSVLASDAFGDIAEGNVAEFLQYLPGVVLDYTDDEARGVSIRGMDSKYGIVTQDGARLPSSSSTSNGDTRSVSFEQMNIANAEVIEVNKMLTADLDADAPAGTVNIRSNSPLDRKNMHWSTQFGFSANSAMIDRGNTNFGDGYMAPVRPGGSISFSNNYFGRKLGIHLSAGIQDYLSLTETMNLVYYPGGSGREPPWLYAISMQELKQMRRRSSAALSLDWQATRALRLSLKTTWSDSWRDVRSYTLNFGSASGNATCDWPYTYLRVRDNTGVANSGGFNYIKNDTLGTITPSFTYKRGNLSVDGFFSYSRAMTDYSDMDNGYFGRIEMGVPGLTFGAVRNHPSSTAWNVLVDKDLEDPSIYSMRNRNGASTIASRPYHIEKTLYSSAVNFKWILPWGVPSFIKTGVSHRSMVHRERRPYAYWTYLGPDERASTGDEHFEGMVSSFSFDKLLEHFGVTIYGPDGPMLMPVPDKTAFAREFELHPERFGPRVDDLQLSRVYNAWDEVPAAYVLGNARFGRLHCQAGLRFESYNIHMKQPFDNTYEGWAWHEKTYNNYFASGSAKWSFTSNTTLRAGFAQSILYPDVNKLRAFMRDESIPPDDPDYDQDEDFYALQQGNWNLKPERAMDYSIELEYYGKQMGQFLFSVYYKDIKDVQYLRWLSEDGGDSFYRKWHNYAQFDYPGFEIEYQKSLRQYKSLPIILRRFSISANYARNLLKSENEVVQGGTTPHSAGMRLSYRSGRLVATLSGIYIGERFNSMREASTPDRYSGEYIPYVAEIQRLNARLNFNFDLQYDFSPRRSRVVTKLVLSGRNIFNEPIRRYSNDPAYLTYISVPYTQWNLSVKVSM
jgi:TonB-dependent receptor